MWKKKSLNGGLVCYSAKRCYSKISPPRPAAAGPVIRVVNNIAHLGSPKKGPKPPQMLSLPPFSGRPLVGKKFMNNRPSSGFINAISWVKYYFDNIPDSVIHSHFRNDLVLLECEESNGGVSTKSMRKIRSVEAMKVGARVHVPISIPKSKISKIFDCIPSGTLYPNADEIAYLKKLVIYKDDAILVLNKPPKLPIKGNLPVHNSMDALAAAALSYGNDEGPKLVHKLDTEASGLLLMGRTKESVARLQWLFTDINVASSSSKIWNDACAAKYQKYWALVIGCPEPKEGFVTTPLSKVFLNDGKTEHVVLASRTGLEPFQEAVTEYRVLGPVINGCSWIELQPHTSRKHQLRVHCAEALGCPIVGDYKYGWFRHKKWKQMPRADYHGTTGEEYRMKRVVGIKVQRGSVLCKVPLLHLHFRELVIPNMAAFLHAVDGVQPPQPHLIRFLADMPSHMKISWNLMSFLV